MKRNTPLISVGLTTYNRGALLRVAIQKILAQTYKNIEIVIADDGSTDNTQSICKTFARKDKRIRYFRQKQNVGMNKNYTFALNKARGKYFIWAADDDKWKNNYLEALAALLQTYPDAVVAASSCRFYSKTKEFISTTEAEPFTRPHLSVRIFLPNEVLVLYGLTHRDALVKTGGYKSYPWPIPSGIGETVHMFRLLLQGGVAFTPRVLWEKEDTGHAMDPFSTLKYFPFSRDVLWRIRRYVVFPLLFFYEAAIMTHDVLRSSYNAQNKIHLLITVFTYYIFNSFYVFSNIVRGILTVILAPLSLLRRNNRIKIEDTAKS